MDPYRAGIKIAENLQGIDPEIIFLFSSIHYGGSQELTEAIYDVIDSDELIIIGCSGDGFYERNIAANVGASALAVNSRGSVHWHLEQESNIGQKPFVAARRCIKRLNQACPDSEMIFLFSDFRTDASEIMRGVSSADGTPVVGGMASDNFDLKQSFVYINREVVTDSIVMLAANGLFPFEIFTVHNLNPDGLMGTISKCHSTTIQTINDLPAMQFVENAMGKPLEYMDTGTITANVINPHNPHLIQHRSLLLSKKPEHNSDIQLFGSIAQGEHIQLCLTNSDNIIAEVETVAADLNRLSFQPAAAIIISCAGRKQLLGNKNSIEVSALASTANCPKAIAGFPSLGEISPLKTGPEYSPPLFHNMTYVLVVFGEKES